MYKNDSSAEPAHIESEAENPEFVNLEGIPNGTAQRRNSENEEGLEVEDTTDQQTEQGTSTVAVRGLSEILDLHSVIHPPYFIFC
jgi:hypothetical protein